MRIIDANTGIEPSIGQTFTNINGTLRLVAVREGLFSAKALFKRVGSDEDPFWVPLKVRYTHPSFMFQKVAFIPS